MWRARGVSGCWPQSERGQATVEYLVIASVVVAAILAIKLTLSGNLTKLYAATAKKVEDAAACIAKLPVPGVGGGTPNVNCP